MNFIKRIFCKMTKHTWHNYTALNYIPNKGFTGVHKRECENCGKVENRYN